MTTGYLHSIESLGLVDGPGIRTVLFLQGCTLRCSFCHNPDSQAFIARQPIDAEQVLTLAGRNRSYYGQQGGVTFSGGEPLAQPVFLYEALQLLKENDYHTCVDTSGMASPAHLRPLLPYVDLFLLDIKAFTDESFKEMTGGEKRQLDRFIRTLREEDFAGKIWIRHVMVPGRTDSQASMDQLSETIEPLRPWIERIEILPYHTMGVDKYEEMGLSYPLAGVPAMDKERAAWLETYVRGQFFAGEAAA